MATRRGKITSCGKSEARNRLAVGAQYQTLAHLAAGEDSSAARNAAVGNAVLAGIAAADAFCCLRLGRRSASSDHSDAIAMLALVDSDAARQLASLIGDKGPAHYGDTFLGPEALKGALRAMDGLIQLATAALQEAGR